MIRTAHQGRTMRKSRMDTETKETSWRAHRAGHTLGCRIPNHRSGKGEEKGRRVLESQTVNKYKKRYLTSVIKEMKTKTL